MSDLLKGFVRGLTADVVGGPADLATILANAGIAGVGFAGHKLGLLKTPPELLEAKNVPLTSDWLVRNTPLQNPGTAAYSAGQFTGNIFPGIASIAKNASAPSLSQLNAFIGPKARNFPYPALKKAEELDAADATPEEIFKQTGLARGAEGIWRKEIDDAGLRFRNGDTSYLDIPPSIARLPWDQIQAAMKSRREGPLFGAISHPELQANYPQFGQMTSDLFKRPSWHNSAEPSGGFYPGRKHIEANFNTAAQARSVLAHELQHAIQAAEKMAPGGSPESVRGKIYEGFAKNFPEYKAFQLKQMTDVYKGDPAGYAKIFQAPPEAVEMARRLTKPQIRDMLDAKMGIAGLDDFELYKRLSGEVEARNVQTRLGMSPADRANIPFWETADYPISKQIALPAERPLFSGFAKK